MSKIRIAVLRGGPSKEYEVSLKSGGAVIEALPEDQFIVSDILVSKDGVWHKSGVPIYPYQALHNVDVVFNALHGEYGEDGQVQKILEVHGVPYTGSKSLASALSMDKSLSRKIVGGKVNVKQPSHITIESDSVYDLDNEAKNIFNKFGPPYVIKPRRGGSSIGVTIVKDLRQLTTVLERNLRNNSVIVEQYIKGKEATCAVVEGLRGEELYSLPPIEIKTGEGQKLFDYEAKYGGEVEEIVPGNFTKEEKYQMQTIAQQIHTTLGLRHYSRTDFIVARNGIYFLETNSLPGLTHESLLPKAADAVGLSFDELIVHLINQAIGQ